VHPNFSLLLESSAQNGLVMHQDLHDEQHHEYVMYPFCAKLVGDELEHNIQKLNDSKKKTGWTCAKNNSSESQYIYLDRSAEAANQLLVTPYQYRHRQRLDRQPLRPLFNPANPPPPGFILNSNVHLFDTKLACVYIFSYTELMKRFKLASNSSSHTPYAILRTNVPFEKYFNCQKVMPDNEESSLGVNSNRCDKIPPPLIVPTTMNLSNLSSLLNNKKRGFFAAPENSTIGTEVVIIVAVFVFIIVTLLAGILWTWSRRTDEIEEAEDDEEEDSRRKRKRKRSPSPGGGRHHKKGKRESKRKRLKRTVKKRHNKKEKKPKTPKTPVVSEIEKDDLPPSPPDPSLLATI
jgi:hypothetical protein